MGGGGGGESHSGYTFHGDPTKTFQQFFGTSNPFESFFNMPGMGSNPHQGFFNDGHTDGMDTDDPFAGFGSSHNLGANLNSNVFNGKTPYRSQSFNVGSKPSQKQQDPPVEHDLYVSLDDICKGVTKRMKISRRVVAGDGTAKKGGKGFNNKCEAWLEVGNQDHFSERRRSSTKQDSCRHCLYHPG